MYLSHNVEQNFVESMEVLMPIPTSILYCSLSSQGLMYINATERHTWILAPIPPQKIKSLFIDIFGVGVMQMFHAIECGCHVGPAELTT